MDAGSPRGGAKSEINVTPLIDIVLVLLIVFIVMVPSLSKLLPVSVPRVVTTPVPPEKDPANPPVVISVLPEGAGFRYLLQSTPIQLAEVPDKLTPVLLRQVPGMRKVVLKVDGEVPYQAAVDILDQIRLASDQAKQQMSARSSVDGGDTRVVISLKKN
ncbi:MAG TPA: biopolymer transporter ExbD [Holophaga sp.]|nr:biopolymer transporter ExbD [Holophaga sp.]